MDKVRPGKQSCIRTWCEVEEKLEMLGSIVSCLASPRKILGENVLSTQDGIKHPEMLRKVKKKFLEVKQNFGGKQILNFFFPEKQKLPKIAWAAQKSHFQGGGVPARDRQPDGQATSQSDL